MPITPLPDPPDDLDPVNFPARAVAWNNHIKGTHRTEMNALEANVVAKETAAAASATAAASSATGAANSNTGAGVSAAAAAASAASALNAPGTNGTSTTSLTMGMGSFVVTTQSGKAWVPGQTIFVAKTASPNEKMVGTITAYSGTALAFDVQFVYGSGTAAAWTIGMAALYSPLPDSAGQHGKVAVVSGSAIGWDYADKARPVPSAYHGVLTNLVLQSDACDSAVSPWSLGGALTRVGLTSGRRGNANGATVYSAAVGSSFVTQAFTGLTAGSWYTVSVYARLESGAAPSFGTLISVDRDVDGIGGTVERSSVAYTGIDAVWQRFELPFYVAGTTATLYLAADSNNGAEIAICDAQINAGRRATTYCSNAGTAGASLATPTTGRMSNGNFLAGWSFSGTGGATGTFLPDGTMTPDGRLAVRLTETNAVSGVYRVFRTSLTFTSGVNYVARMLARADSMARVYLSITSGFSSAPTAHFNLETGEAYLTTAVVRRAWAERVDDQWWMLNILTGVASTTTVANVYVGITSSPTSQTHLGVIGAGLYLGGLSIAPNGEAKPPNWVDLAGGAVSIGHASLQARSVNHVDTTEGPVDLLLPPPFADDWLEVVDVGRASATNRIRLLRGVAPAIGGLAEDMDINLNGAGVRLRADIEKGWVLA